MHDRYAHREYLMLKNSFLVKTNELTLRSCLKFLKLVKSAAGGIDEKFEP